MLRPLVLATLGLLSLASCTRNTIIFVMPQRQVANAMCQPPAGHPVYARTPSFQAHFHWSYPAAAVAAGVVTGCGGVEYYVDAYGRATGVRVVSEQPEGYGFGALAVTAASQIDFSGGRGDGKVRYLNFSIRNSGSVRAPVMQAPGVVQPMPVQPEGLVGYNPLKA